MENIITQNKTIGLKCPQREMQYQFHLQTKYALEIYLTIVNKVRGLTGGQVGAAFLQVLSDCEPGRE